MSFNSIQFILLLATVLIVYWQVSRRAQNVVLLIASAIFYGWWDARFLALIYFSVGLDFMVSRAIQRSDDVVRRRRLLMVSLLGNLGVLAFFKYAGFFVDSARQALESIGLGTSGPFIEVLLPVGISFYTFQTLAYTIDVYRGEIEAESSLLDFAVFVTYFPQLVAGPIERASRLLPQIRTQRPALDQGRVLSGLSLIGLGLFRKVVIADGVGATVNAIYDDPSSASALAVVVATVGFAIQVYGDFAGYTDIARGTSRLLGIELMRNFTEPYLSRNITEFWRRWHISLSEWLRDYLYIPLGGNRRGPLRTPANLMITMLLGGLWHGAGWGFILWGALHGVGLVAHRRWIARNAGSATVDTPLAFGQIACIVGTVGFFALTLVPFRGGVSATWEFAEAVLTLRGGGVPSGAVLTVAFGALLTLGLDLARRGVIDVGSRVLSPVPVRGAVAGAAFVALVVFSGGGSSPFIYFQF